jgi:hypothetical protein
MTYHGFGLDDFSHYGDALTNFDVRQKPIYEEAIKRYGDAMFYIGEPITWKSRQPPYECLALRYRGPRGDLSEFWRAFERVKAEHAAASLASPGSTT